MDKAKYFALLGLKPTANAAEIEAAYLAISQHLEPQKVDPPLRQWATEQGALVDEAYAILTGAGDDVADDETQEVASQPRKPKSPRQTTSIIATKSKVATQRRRDDEDDEFDEYDEAYDDDYEQEPEPPRRAAAPTPRTSSRREATWQQTGKRRPSRGGVPVARRSDPPKDNRVRNIVLGLAGGIAVLLLVYIAMQTGLLGKKPEATGVTFDQARYAQLKAVVAKDPTNYDALFELGEMNIDADRYDETIEWFQRVLAVKPDDVHAMQDIGTANFNLGSLDKARDIWLKALVIDPNNAQTHWNLSFLYISQQPPDADAAMNEWQKVIELAPNTEIARLSQSHIDSYKNVFQSTPSAGAAATPSR